MKNLNLDKIINDNENINSLDCFANKNGSLLKLLTKLMHFLAKNDFDYPFVKEHYEDIAKQFLNKNKLL